MTDAGQAHSFFVDVGDWAMAGQWLEPNQAPEPIQGRILVTWSQDDWFTMATKLIFPKSMTNKPPLTFQYRGKLGYGDSHYTFVLQHSQWGRVEGVGWVGSSSIVKRFWLLGDPAKKGGFESYWQISPNQYVMTANYSAGNKNLSLLEATLTLKTN